MSEEQTLDNLATDEVIQNPPTLLPVPGNTFNRQLPAPPNTVPIVFIPVPDNAPNHGLGAPPEIVRIDVANILCAGLNDPAPIHASAKLRTRVRLTNYNANECLHFLRIMLRILPI